MAQALDIQKSGGSVAYLSGSEIGIDLSSASVDCEGLSNPLAYIGKTLVVWSTTDNKSFKLPNGNRAGLSVAQGTCFIVPPWSRPIKLLNQGTAGTDAVLEAFMLPGSKGKVVNTSITSGVVGNWKGIDCQGWFNGAVPALINNADAGLDLGAAINVSNDNTLGHFASSTSYGGCAVARLSSTLYVFVYQTATTSISAVAASYVHATDTLSWGTPVTVASTANGHSVAGIVPLGSAAYAIAWWEATAAVARVRGGTVSGNTITQGTAIVSGAWAVNPSNIAVATTTSVMIPDSSTTFFWAAKYDGTHLAVMHFSISGANVAQDGGSAFGSSAPDGGSRRWWAFSPAANKIDMGISSTNGNHCVSRYTYSAGSVTAVNLSNIVTTGCDNGQVWCSDATLRSYYIPDGSSSLPTYIRRVSTDSGFTVISQESKLVMPTWGNDPAYMNTNFLLPFSDNEFVGGNPGTIGFGITCFDPNNTYYKAQSFVGSTSGDNGIVTHISPSTQAFLPFKIENARTGYDFHISSRRCIFIEPLYDSASTTALRRIRGCVFDLPRNYDKPNAA